MADSEKVSSPPWSFAGPWSWDGSYPIRVVDYAGYVVCDGIMPSRERDAKLICAAPDLLEACQLFLAYQAAIGSDDYHARPLEKYSAAMGKAREAIAKATGEQQ